MAQNRDRNWQDERGPQAQRGGGWQQHGEDYGTQHTGQYRSPGEGAWNDGREGIGGTPGYWQGSGYGQQQGGEWNRMGRYGEEGWQGAGYGQQGGQGRWSQGGNYRMDRDFGHQGYRGSSGSSFGGMPEGQGMGRSSAGEAGYASSRGSWGGGYGSSFGSSSHGTPGYGSQGYGGMPGRPQGQRGFWDRASDEVSSWFGDEQAQNRREQDEYRGRGPRGYIRSDERIREDVNDRFTDDGRLDASDIGVEVDHCEVTLTGQVGSREDKRRAEDIADAVSGVKHVQNNLRVKERDAGMATSAAQFGSGASGGSAGMAGTPTSKTATGK